MLKYIYLSPDFGEGTPKSKALSQKSKAPTFYLSVGALKAVFTSIWF